MIALRLLCFSLILSFACYNASAQVTDTTVVLPPDTLRVPLPDSAVAPLQASIPPKPITARFQIPFLDEGPGLAFSDSLPTTHAALDPAGLLSDVAGSFLYDFGTSGWPDGWSPFGIAPHDVALSFNGIPFDNTIAGTSEFELLPFPILQPFKLQAGRFGAPLTVNTRLRGLDVPRPLTEIRYRQSNNGLKSVLVFHSQQRRMPLRRQMGTLGITLAYGGHGAAGEYAGSQLEGARQLLARIRYKHPWGSIEMMNLSNRRRLGAQGGVVVDEAFYDAIYNRFGSTVINADAQRQSLRNDLALTLRSKILPDSTRPFSAMTYWTAGTFRYVLGDTLQARTSRLGYRISQDLGLNLGALAGNVTVALEGWTENLRKNSTALPDSLELSRSALNFSVLGSVPLGPLSLELEPGLHKNENESFVAGRGRVSYDRGWIKLFSQASYSGQTHSWIQRYGWGGTVSPLAAFPESRVTHLQAGIALHGGPFNLDVTAFVNQSKNYTDYFASATSDSISVALFPSPVEWSGVSADFGIRKYAARGFYVTVTPTLYQLNNPGASAAHSMLLGSLPEVFIQGRFGLRYRIFQGDLDFDLYTKARLWSSFQSRTLHPETGLLVLRPPGSRPVDESVAMDIVLEAGIRTATLFLVFENVLSHPSILVGNVLVPDYPLPAQRFRFGVYWPIQD